MDALQKQGTAFVKRQLVPAYRPLGGFKVKAGHADRPAAEQSFQAFGQKRHIQRLHMLQIRLAVRLQRYVPAVTVKVVQRHQPGLFSQYAQVNGKAVCEGRLSAGGWTEDHDNPRVPRHNFIRDARDGFVVQRFVDTDELPHPSFLNHTVDVGRVSRAKDPAPPLRNRKFPQELWPRHIGCGFLGFFRRRGHQHHARKVRLDREGPDIAC